LVESVELFLVKLSHYSEAGSREEEVKLAIVLLVQLLSKTQFCLFLAVRKNYLLLWFYWVLSQYRLVRFEVERSFVKFWSFWDSFAGRCHFLGL